MWRVKRFQRTESPIYAKTLGKSTVSIGERREPPYDADEADIKEARDNIRKNLEEERKIGFWDRISDNNEEIYIKNFYKDSVDTIMIYTHKGEQYYSYVKLDGSGLTASFLMEESEREYYDRMLEYTFPLYD